MSRNWIRHFKLTAEGGAKEIDLSSLACVFDIFQFTAETPNNASVRIINPSAETARQFTSAGAEFKKITIEAGYQDNKGVLFKGNIVQARYGRLSPTDKYLDIFAADGDQAYNFATVSKTLAAGSTPKDHYDVAIKAMGEHGAKAGFNGLDLSSPRYPRPVVLFGMARDVLRNIAHAKDANWSIQNGEIEMVKPAQTKPGGAIKLNSETGLVGMPTQEISGIQVRCLINPQIRVHSLIHIDEASIQKARLAIDAGGNTQNPQNARLPDIATDGLYKVLRIDVHGESHNDSWHMMLGCVAASGSGYLPDALKLYQGPQ